MRVNLRRGHVAGAEKLLDGPDIPACLEQVRGERVAERVTGSALRDPGTADRVLDGALHHRLVKMVAPALAGLALDVDARGREDPLPRPLATGAGVFPGQCPRQLDPARPMLEIAFVLPLDGL